MDEEKKKTWKEIQEMKNILHQGTLESLQRIPQDYKGNLERFEEDFATNIALLSFLTENELTLCYCDRIGYDRQYRLRQLIKSERNRAVKYQEQIELEGQWNPDFLDWFKERFQDQQEEGELDDEND
jgi:hypothetical protein